MRSRGGLQLGSTLISGHEQPCQHARLPKTCANGTTTAQGFRAFMSNVHSVAVAAIELGDGGRRYDKHLLGQHVGSHGWSCASSASSAALRN
jgi:hypothetical protein